MRREDQGQGERGEDRPDLTFERVRTPRPELRRFAVDDRERFVAYRWDPEVARCQSGNAPFPIESAERFLADLATHPGTGRCC